jgi:predicted dehydrogenase
MLGDMITTAAIGTSSITRRTVAAAVPVAGLRFGAVHSRDADRAAALASDLGIARGTADLAGLLASPDIDAVYVASPNSVHAQQVRAALEAGKHVFVEKPAVATAAEWVALCALADARGLVLLENMRTAHDPVMTRVRELLPSLGTLRHVAFHFGQRSARYDEVLAGRRVNVFDPALGGGALNDLGVYVVHPLVRLFGTPSRTAASVVTLPTGADGAGAALFTYPGLVAEVSWSKITAGTLANAVEGELGTLTLDHITDLGHVRVDYLDGRRLDERPAKEPDNITHALRRFVELVEGGGSASEDQRWTRDTLATLEAVRSAAAQGSDAAGAGGALQ